MPLPFAEFINLVVFGWHMRLFILFLLPNLSVLGFNMIQGCC